MRNFWRLVTVAMKILRITTSAMVLNKGMNLLEDDRKTAMAGCDEDVEDAEDTNHRGAPFGVAASPKPFPGIYAAAAAATCPT